MLKSFGENIADMPGKDTGLPKLLVFGSSHFYQTTNLCCRNRKRLQSETLQDITVAKAISYEASRIVAEANLRSSLLCHARLRQPIRRRAESPRF